MKQYDDADIMSILSLYEVDGPDDRLVSRTKHLMIEELACAQAAAPVQVTWVFVVVGLALAMSLCLFYMLTVGTILRFVLPVGLLTYLKHSFYGLTAAGGSVLAFALLTLVMKFVWLKRTDSSFRTVRY